MHNHPFRPARTLLYLSIAQERALGCEHPIGDPWGGPAFGEKNKGGVFSQTYWEKGGIVNSVASLVTNPIGYTNDRLKELDKTVIQPIGNGLEKVGQGIANDPVTFVATVAAMATPGMQWAVPLIQMASVAAHGGSFEDVLKAGAISAATTVIAVKGSDLLMGTMKVAQGAATAYQIAGQQISQTTARVIAQGVSYAAAGATTAAVTGKNIGEAALTGAITGGLAGGAQGLAQADFMKDFAATIDKVATSGVGNAVVNGIAGAAGAALTGAITGQDASTQIGMALVGGAVNGLASAVKISGDFFSNNAAEALDLQYDDYGPNKDISVAQYLTDKLGPAGAGFVTNTVTSILSSTFTKGNPSAFLAQQVMGNLVTAIKNAFDPKFKAQYVDPLEGYVDDAKAAAEEYNASANRQNALGEEINGNVTTYNNRVAAVNQIINQRAALADQYNSYTSANSSQAQVDSTYAQIQALDSQITAEVNSLNSFYQTGIIDKQAQYAQLNDQTLALQKTYVGYADALGDASVPLTKYLNDVTKDMAIKTAQTLDPNFNPEEYRTLNGLSPTDDVGAHYISTGKDQGLYTNFASSEAYRADLQFKAMDQFARGMGYPGAASLPESIYNDALDKMQSHMGNNLKAWESFTPDSFLQQVKLPPTAIMPMWDSESREMTVAKVIYDNGQEQLVNVTTKLPEGREVATAMQIMKGQADVVRGNDGNFYWTTSTGTNPIYKEGSMIQALIGPARDTPPEGATNAVYDTNGRLLQFDQDGQTITNVTVYGTAEDTDNVADTTPKSGTSLNDLDPLMQMYTYSAMPDGIAANFNVKGIVQASKDIVDYMQKDASDIDKLKIATVVKSAGSVMQDVGTVLGDLSVTIGLSKTNNSTLADLGKQLEGLAEAKTPAEYKAAMADIKAMRDAAKGTDIVAVNAAIAQKYPDLVGISVFGGELFEELIQNGVGKAAMVAGGALAATLGAPALIAGAIGAGVGYGAAMAMDFSESYRGAKEDMYQRMYDIYKEKGYSDAQAAQMADGAATKAGVMNGLITMVVNGATPGDLNKVLFGGKASPAQEAITNYFVDKLVTAGKVAASEFGQGLVEGTLQGMYNETLVYSVDPSKADYAKGMADSAMLESIIGAPVSVGAYAVDNSFEMAQKTFTLANEQFTTALESPGIYTIGELGTVMKAWGVPPTVSMSMLPDIIDGNPALLNAYGSPAELTSALQNSFGFDATQAADIANIKFNTQITTADEAKTALLNAGLTNVTNQDAVNAGLIGTTTADQTTKATNYANQQMVSEAEVRAAAAQENYTLTAEELSKLIGRGVQADVIAKFISEVDPKAVTTAEATQYFKDLGYTKARAEDIAQFVKSAPEEAMKTAVAEWVNPRQVTRAEALQFFSELGYTPTESEIAQFVVQGPEVFQDAIKQQLGAYVDPRFVDAAEVREAFKNMGLNAPVAASDIARLSGQYAETELAGKAKEALPVVSANSLFAMLNGDPAINQNVKDEILAKIEDYKALNMTQAEAQKAATQAVAAQLNTTTGNLLTALGATENNLLVKISNVEANLTTKIEDYKNQGLTQAEATSKALAEMSAQLGTTKNELLTQLGTTENNLIVKLASTKQELADKIDQYRSEGLTQSEATKKALDEMSAQIGVNKADILATLGATEANLQTKLTDATKLLQDQITANQNAGMDAIAATNKAVQDVAAQLGTTTDELKSQISTSNADLAKKIAESQAASQAYTQQQVQQSQAAIMDKMAQYEAAGQTRDQALQSAINDVSAQLGTTANNLLAQMGTNQQQLLAQIGQTQTQLQTDIAKAKSDIQTQMEAYEQAGIDRDTALSLAISGVSQQLGTTKADLLSQLGTTENNLKAELAQQGAQLTGQIQGVQQLVGRPTQQATAADATTIQGMIAGTTPVNLAYDTNNDGKVDQTDLTNVQNQLAFQQNQNLQQQIDTETGLPVWIDKTTGQPVSGPSALGGQWAPTGIYAALQQQEARQAATAKAAAAQAKQAQQKNQFGQLVNMLFSAPDAAGQQVTVKTPEPSKINYIYDWSSIFATPSQASLMPSPYGPMNTVAPQQQKQASNQPLFQFASGFAEGGIVGGNDINVGDGGSVDDLINLLKGNSG